MLHPPRKVWFQKKEKKKKKQSFPYFPLIDHKDSAILNVVKETHGSWVSSTAF